MTKVPPAVLGFMFLCSAASVLVVGYRHGRAYPLATVVCCLVALATLGRWYVLARHGDDQAVDRTLRKLTFFLLVLVLVVPYVLGVVLKP
jgi:4-hydroxybenzoate polyprenyltransferase